ncbi:hypothetical protein [Sorangium sp. So ce406]|uniref:hypothetical protein n=1 Tax=Sorangium sp. So ce406 TaxID=3133311 RepID=UPI003F5C20D4
MTAFTMFRHSSLHRACGAAALLGGALLGCGDDEVDEKDPIYIGGTGPIALDDFGTGGTPPGSGRSPPGTRKPTPGSRG